MKTEFYESEILVKTKELFPPEGGGGVPPKHKQRDN
jgi:hypothetical protein